MKKVYVRGSSEMFGQTHYMTIPKTSLGVYNAHTKTAYIFLDEISKYARDAWIITSRKEFNGHKGLQRYYIRIRKLIEYHEYGHHLQHMKQILGNSRLKEHNEHVADRYARLRYFKDYRRTTGFQFDRRPMFHKDGV